MVKERDVESSRDEGTEKGTTSRAGLLLVGLAGSVIGAAAALLLAPWRGAETRRRLKEAAATAGSAAKEKASALKDKADSLLRKGEDEDTESKARDD
jgi:gas vesicle protein